MKGTRLRRRFGGKSGIGSEIKIRKQWLMREPNGGVRVKWRKRMVV